MKEKAGHAVLLVVLLLTVSLVFSLSLNVNNFLTAAAQDREASAIQESPSETIGFNPLVGGSSGFWPMFRFNVQHTALGNSLGPHTNTLKWTFTTGGAVQSSPAVASDGTIIFGSNDSKIYALNMDGSIKWNYTTGGAVTSSPAIDGDGFIYIGSNDGKLYALNPDGTLKWSYATVGPIQSSPVIDPSTGTIYIAAAYDSSSHGWLYALNPNGTLKWSYMAPGSDSWIVGTPALDTNGEIIFGDCTNPNGYVTKMDPNGTVIWRTVVPSAGENALSSSPNVSWEHYIYINEGSPTGGAQDLVCIDSNGNIIRRFATGSYAHSSPATGHTGLLYFGSNDGKFYAVDPLLGSAWSYDAGTSINSSPAVGSDGMIYFGTNGVGLAPTLIALNSFGQLIWSYTTGGSVVSSPAIGPERSLYVGCDDGKLYAFQSTEPSYYSANGHYYEAIAGDTTWLEANATASLKTFNGLKGHLVTITSVTENNFVTNALGGPIVLAAYWLGGYQLANSFEPAGGWEWVTGELWTYTNWYSGEPSNNYSGDWGGHPAGWTEDCLQFGPDYGQWSDSPSDVRCKGYIIEYESTPKYYPTNGHYYDAVSNGGSSWDVANAEAQSMTYNGLTGHLATVTTQAEWDFIQNNLGGGALFGYTLGGYQQPGGIEPDGDWRWITGEPWNYNNWQPGEPNDSGNGQPENVTVVTYGGYWNDVPGGGYFFIVEYESQYFVQQAINAANAGDTIFIPSGTYYENVVVNKSVTLIGAGSENTIINGMNVGPALLVEASNVTINKFGLTGGINETVLLGGYSRYCVFANNTVSYGNERGILIFGGDSRVYNNVFYEIGLKNYNANAGHGVIECASDNNIISNNLIHHCYTWALGSNSGNNNQYYNNVVYAGYAGSQIDWNANGNRIYNNTFSNCRQGIIGLNLAHNNTFSNNEITNCGGGINFSPGPAGSAYNNTLSENTIINCNITAITLNGSGNNLVLSNNITSNNYGLQFTNSSINNQIYHNYFVGNNIQVTADASSASNTFDTGYPSGGNYWSNYTESDRFNGINQNLIGPDGIGDQPFSTGSIVDNYPLVNASTASQTPIASYRTSPTTPIQGKSITFDASADTTSRGTFIYQWNFGDDTPTTNTSAPTISHTYSQSGSYTVNLTIYDANGTSITKSTPLSISPTPPSTPTPTATVTPTNNPTPTPTNITSTPTPTPISNETSNDPLTALYFLGMGPISDNQLSKNPFSLFKTPDIPQEQLAATAIVGAGVVGIASVGALAVVVVPERVDSFRDLPGPVQRFVKASTNKALDNLFKPKANRKSALVTAGEIGVLIVAVIFTAVIVAYCDLKGYPNAMNPTLFLGAFTTALLSAVTVQSASLIGDVICSYGVRAQKKLNLWNVGTLTWFITGIFLQFPFSSPSISKTLGDSKHKILIQKRIAAFNVGIKASMVGLLFIPFTLMSILDFYPKVGNTGLLTTTVALCCTLLPFKPFNGKDIRACWPKLSIALAVLAVSLVVLQYLTAIDTGVYLGIGFFSVTALFVIIWKVSSEKTKFSQNYPELWF